jgi:excisionase family DNA binding protein
MVHPLLDKNRVAEILNVSVRSVDRIRKCGLLTSVKVGTRVLFSAQDVEAFINAQRRGGSHE